METLLSLFEEFLWVYLLIQGVVIAHLIGRIAGAKILKVPIRELKIGMGDASAFVFHLFQIRFSVTNWPLGGSVAMEQESRPAPEDADGNSASITAKAPSLAQKVLSLMGGPVMTMVLATILLSVSLVFFGDTSYTMQVVHTLPDSPAEAAGFTRGDILLEVNGQKVTKFELGQRFISQNPGKEIDILVERKKDYKEFNDSISLHEYLEKEYKPRSYIKVFGRAQDEPAIFYAKEAAVSHLDTIDLQNLRVEISEGKIEEVIKVTPNSFGRIGIGIKPYSLENLTVYPNPIQSIGISLSYLRVLVQEFLLELRNLTVNFMVRGNIPLELNLIKEIFQFFVDIGDLNGNEYLKLFAMIAMSVSVLGFFPFPGSIGYLALALILREGLNNSYRNFSGRRTVLIDDEFSNYARWLYKAGFALVFVLFIFHSLPSISG